MLKKLMISEILKFACNNFDNKEEKIEFLRKYRSEPLYDVLRCLYDDRIKFLLPSEEPKFKPNDPSYGHMKLFHEYKKLYLFVEGGNNNLKPSRREELFVQFLESIHPDDAKLMIHIKNKKLPWKGLNKEIIKEVFPEMFIEEEQIKISKPFKRKLKKEDVLKIRQFLIEDKTFKEIASMFNVSESAIRDIKYGVSWVNVK